MPQCVFQFKTLTFKYVMQKQQEHRLIIELHSINCCYQLFIFNPLMSDIYSLPSIFYQPLCRCQLSFPRHQ